jgi:hypothetical protein
MHRIIWAIAQSNRSPEYLPSQFAQHSEQIVLASGEIGIKVLK